MAANSVSKATKEREQLVKDYLSRLVYGSDGRPRPAYGAWTLLRVLVTGGRIEAVMRHEGGLEVRAVVDASAFGGFSESDPTSRIDSIGEILDFVLNARMDELGLPPSEPPQPGRVNKKGAGKGGSGNRAYRWKQRGSDSR